MVWLFLIGSVPHQILDKCGSCFGVPVSCVIVTSTMEGKRQGKRKFVSSSSDADGEGAGPSCPVPVPVVAPVRSRLLCVPLMSRK